MEYGVGVSSTYPGRKEGLFIVSPKSSTFLLELRKLQRSNGDSCRPQVSFISYNIKSNSKISFIGVEM